MKVKKEKVSGINGDYSVIGKTSLWFGLEKRTSSEVTLSRVEGGSSDGGERLVVPRRWEEAGDGWGDNEERKWKFKQRIGKEEKQGFQN